MQKLLSAEVEIEHILPFSQTLDDSLNNKTVSLKKANRVKGNRIPWDAKGDFEHEGWSYDDIFERAQGMPRPKRYRFAKDGYKNWLKKDKDFIARALNDTRYLSRIARLYLELICPKKVRVIPGQMTALLRGHFGLNKILGLNGEKNRNNHRHHAIDACVIGVTDQGLLQQFAKASSRAEQLGLERLVEVVPYPWKTFREHVLRAVSSLKVSHRPDHSHEGQMHNDTAYGKVSDEEVFVHKMVDGKREKVIEKLKVIGFKKTSDPDRHGVMSDGTPKNYKFYKPDSNYCMEIFVDEKNKWQSNMISTFEAYQIVKNEGLDRLRSKDKAQNDKPLVMRLMRNDTLKIVHNGSVRLVRICQVSNGAVICAELDEANVDARTRDKNDSLTYIKKSASALQKSKAQVVTVSPAGKISTKKFYGG